MRILIVSPYYHPHENPRAYRCTLLSEYFANMGSEVHVLTSNDHRLGNESSRIKIHRVGVSTPDKRWTKDKTAARSLPVPNFIKSIYRRQTFPDVSSSWLKAAKSKFSQLLDQQNFDVVISSSLPFSSHLLVYKTIDAYKFKWIMDIGDPFAFLGLNNSKRKIDLESKCIARADSIVVTNDGIRSKYLEHFELPPDKIHTIGPISVDHRHEHRPKHSSSKIKVGYFGSFYAGVREPSDFIDHLQSTNDSLLDKIEFHFYGSIKKKFAQAITSRIQNHVHFHGAISRNQIQSKIQDMDILLSFGNRSGVQLPSKVVDYALSGKPILHFQEIDEDLVPGFFEGYDAFYLVEKEIDWESISKGVGNVEFIEKIRQGHSIEALGRKFFALFGRNEGIHSI